MASFKVTCENLPQIVEVALNECTVLLNSQREGRNNALARDLQIALSALRLIKSELRGNPGRQKNQRSAAFTRYVIDEENQIVMNDDLKNLIVKIESVYKRC